MKYFYFLSIASLLFSCKYYNKLYGKRDFDRGAYDAELPQNDRPTILVFNKTTAHRHADAIDKATSMFQAIAKKHNYNLIVTENAAIFDSIHLKHIDVTIWNNVSGRVLTGKQRDMFQAYMINGGSFLGIHQAGDRSHHWKWYKEELIGAKMSHHNTKKDKIQTGDLYLDTLESTDPILSKGLKELEKDRLDEWYVFKTNPRKLHADVVYCVDENTINPNAEVHWLLPFWNFGMGEDFPVAWARTLSDGKGKSFYTGMGHTAITFENPNHIQMMDNAIIWLLQK